MDVTLTVPLPQDQVSLGSFIFFYFKGRVWGVLLFGLKPASTLEAYLNFKISGY